MAFPDFGLPERSMWKVNLRCVLTHGTAFPVLQSALDLVLIGASGWEAKPVPNCSSLWVNRVSIPTCDLAIPMNCLQVEGGIWTEGSGQLLALSSVVFKHLGSPGLRKFLLLKSLALKLELLSSARFA